MRLCKRYTEKSFRSTVKILRTPSRSATQINAASAKSIDRSAYLRISSRILGKSPVSKGSNCTAPLSSISQSASCARGRSARRYMASVSGGQIVPRGSRTRWRTETHLLWCWSLASSRATKAPASTSIKIDSGDASKAVRISCRFVRIAGGYLRAQYQGGPPRAHMEEFPTPGGRPKPQWLGGLPPKSRAVSVVQCARAAYVFSHPTGASKEKPYILTIPYYSA